MWESPLWHHQAVQAQWGVVLGAALVAAGWDVRTRRIPNLLTLPLLLAGLLLAPYFGGGWAGLADAVGGMLLLGVPFVVLYAIGGGGAGDAKMMGAIGAWVGITAGLIVLGSVAAVGVVASLAYAVMQRRLQPVMANVQMMTTGLLVHWWARTRPSAEAPLIPSHKAMLTVPYGLSIFLGTALAAGGVLLWYH